MIKVLKVVLTIVSVPIMIAVGVVVGVGLGIVEIFDSVWCCVSGAAESIKEL